MNKLFMTSLVLILAVFFLIFLPVSDNNAEGLNDWTVEKVIGSNAPDFSIKDLSGKKVSLSSFKGKPVLLNFWATWCPYCRNERAELNSLYKEYKEKNLIIISVSTDRSVEKVKRYLKKIPSDFIVLTDSNREVAVSYKVGGLPTSFLINHEGIIKHRLVGFREWSSGNSKKLIDSIIKN
jgi:peroxiredoxin